ncbi:integrase catalytic region (plasmid) [Caballeronia cordobensis]|nr:integrase catalytic region [Burkholderia sp. RPE67]
MNVLKQHLQATIFTLLERGASQRKIHEVTGIDRKTIRRYQSIFELQRVTDEANSSTPAPTDMAEPVGAQTPPPPPQTPPLSRPPASRIVAPVKPFNFARSASEPHREWIEQQIRLKRNAQAM